MALLAKVIGNLSRPTCPNNGSIQFGTRMLLWMTRLNREHCSVTSWRIVVRAPPKQIPSNFSHWRLFKTKPYYPEAALIARPPVRRWIVGSTLQSPE